MKNLVVAALIGAVASVKLNWASGVDQDDVNVDIHMNEGRYTSESGFISAPEDPNVKPVATGLAQVDARWVELPICQYENPQYNTYFPRNMKLPNGQIPLADDLSNSGKATCKGYYRSKDADRLNYETPEWKPNNTKQAYDPVIRQRGDQPIPATEHQVTQHQQGEIEPNDGRDGPELKYNQRTNARDDWKGENKNRQAWWNPAAGGAPPKWNTANPGQPAGSTP